MCRFRKTRRNGQFENVTLIDAYVNCGPGTTNDDDLEELLFNYIQNIPERTLGKHPELANTTNHCLDEKGFLPVKNSIICDQK